MTQKVITRFAPSPTGFLHIGGARTALFNWLYAQSHNGQMLLRIEDTDRTRSTTKAIDAILDGMKWLGINWSDEPVYQHQRADRHREIAEQLLREGKAYHCYCSPQELTKMREDARAKGKKPGYNGMWRERDPALAPDNIKPVVRFKAPDEGDTIIKDRVQGDIRFANKDLDDLILLRSDGSPTYMLSVIVDDHDMGITHIIRGDDHLTNAARQAQIYEALGWTPPVFAHIPLIHGADGAKLSKRHGALGVEAYRAMGYLPEALRNYLVRLGWSHGDEEIFSTAQMIDWFGLENIGKSAARFDFKKLENLNGHYIRESDDAHLIEAIKASLHEFEGCEDLASSLGDEDWQRFLQAMPGLKERAKTLVELVNSARYLFVKRPLSFDKKAAKLLNDEARTMLKNLAQTFTDLEEWSLESIETSIRDFSEQQDLKLGKIAQPLRAAMTGITTSPGIFDVLYVLGKHETLARLGDL
ncbi:MAG: glutamate--tRNA ligase [Hyphomicrobiaceae bacterium]|nr:glutamate--tRNA ligase [Hyphomicrobiaceae bacterium]